MTARTISLSAVMQTSRAAEASVAGHADRCAGVAESLQYLGPFSLYGCLLLTPGKPSLALLDDSGSPQQEWESQLRDGLRRCALEAEADGAASLQPPPDLADASLFVAPIVFQGRRYGALALAAPAEAAEEVSACLGLVAGRLAAQLYLVDDCGNTEENQRLEWLGNMAETTAIVSHEFNNFLNGMMLHLALLRQEAPKAISGELDVMKRLASDAAGLVKKLQDLNGRRRSSLSPLDLNHAVRDALEARPLPAGVAEIAYDFADHLPPVDGARRELGRLLELLLRQAGGAMQDKPGPVTIRTQPAARKVVLRFEDAGPALEGEHLARVFEPFFMARPGVESPGLALVHTLARRLHANIRAENLPQGGVAFVLEFTPAVAAASV